MVLFFDIKKQKTCKSTAATRKAYKENPYNFKLRGGVYDHVTERFLTISTANIKKVKLNPIKYEVPEGFENTDKYIKYKPSLMSDVQLDVTKYRKKSRTAFKANEHNISMTSTSNTSLVKDLVADYVKSNPSMNGKIVNIAFNFKNSEKKYFIPNFTLSQSDLRAKMDAKMDEWNSRQVDYATHDLKESNGFTIIEQAFAGGCKDEIQDFKLKSVRDDTLRKKVYFALVEKKNCLLACFDRFIDEPRFKVEILMNVDKFNKTVETRCEKYRVELKLEPNTNIEMCKEICEYFHVGAKVYKKGQHGFDCVFDFCIDGRPTIELWLQNGHFNLVLSSELLSLTRCVTCCMWVQNYKKHKLSCFFCTACKCKIGKNHDDEKCTNNMAVRNRTDVGEVKPAPKHKENCGEKNMIYADFETFPSSENNEHTVYAVGYAFGSGEVKILKGENALEDFVDMLLSLTNKYTLCFFNGARYDMYFIFKELMSRNTDVKYILGDGSFKKVTFGNVESWDLCQHLPSSLKKLCEAFGTDTKKGDFDHKLIRTFDDVETHEDKWAPYLEDDVKSMRDVYNMYQKEVYELYQVNPKMYISLSSMAYYIWKTMLKTSIKLPTYEIDCFIRRSIYGGKCFAQKQRFVSKDIGKPYAEITDCLHDLDVISLYPAAMHGHMFPTGDFSHVTDVKQCKFMQNKLNARKLDRKNVVYFFEVDMISNKKLVSAPRAVRNSKNNPEYTLFDVCKQVYNTFDLDAMIRMGYTVSKVYQYYTVGKMQPIFDDYISLAFEAKAKAKKDSPKYTVAKLMMNSLYGKMIQKPMIEKDALVHNYKEYMQVFEKGDITYDEFINDDTRLLKYITHEKDKAVSKPSQIGSIILAYSKDIMDGYIEAIDGYTNLETSFFRTDTDSIIVHKEQADQLQDHFQTGVLGELDFDIKGKITKFIEVCPKVYFCEYVTENNEVKKHVRAKGFDSASQQLLTWEDYEHMLYGNESTEVDEVQLSGGKITREGETIKLTLDSKIKKLGMNVNSVQKSNGMERSSVFNVQFERTLNKTRWGARDPIEGHKNYGSLPKGYEK